MPTDPCHEDRTRLRRCECLCLGLAAIAVVWAVVTVVRLVHRPTPLELAERAVAAGDLSSAVECCLTHLVAHPQDWSARLKLADVLSAIDRPQALVELRKIPADAAEYRAALRTIAGICLSRQRYGEAKEALVALDAAAPNDWWTELSLAEVFFRQRDLKLALYHAQRSAELNPAHPRTYFLLAELLDDLDRRAEMVAPLQKLIELLPEEYGAHLNLCYAYAKTGQVGNTRKEAEWCLQRRPQDVAARRLLATAARDEGHHTEARQELQKALQLAPEDLNCRLLEAELLLFERKSDEAFQRLQPLCARHPNEVRLVELLAQAAAAAGRPREAEQYRQQVKTLKHR